MPTLASEIPVSQYHAPQHPVVACVLGEFDQQVSPLNECIVLSKGDGSGGMNCVLEALETCTENVRVVRLPLWLLLLLLFVLFVLFVCLLLLLLLLVVVMEYPLSLFLRKPGRWIRLNYSTEEEAGDLR